MALPTVAIKGEALLVAEGVAYASAHDWAAWAQQDADYARSATTERETIDAARENVR